MKFFQLVKDKFANWLLAEVTIENMRVINLKMGEKSFNCDGNVLTGPYSRINADGGLDMLFTAGSTILAGEIIESNAAGLASGCQANTDMPLGAAYASAASGASCWVTVAGYGYIKPESGASATLGKMIACTTEAGCGTQYGTLAVDAVHFREVGHYAAGGTASGVATKALIHLN